MAADRGGGYENALREVGFTRDGDLVEETGPAVEAGQTAFEINSPGAGWEAASLPTAVVAMSDEVPWE